jgi:hypothetical protein
MDSVAAEVFLMRVLTMLLLLVPASPIAGQQTPATAPGQANTTQEIAGETPAGPAIVADPTEIRIGGYLGLTGIDRSRANGGGARTAFGTIPYEDVVLGNVSETRLSAQPSRLSIRVSTAPAPNRATLAGYFEMDFAGTVPGSVAVTSNSAEFRLRHAFGEARVSAHTDAVQRDVHACRWRRERQRAREGEWRDDADRPVFLRVRHGPGTLAALHRI